jgi:hypothetical protein
MRILHHPKTKRTNMTASNQLQLLNNNFGTSSSQDTRYGKASNIFDSNGNPIVPNTVTTLTLHGDAIGLLRKIAFSTAATANNTSGYGGDFPHYGGAFAGGGVLGPNSFGIFGEHHPQGPFLARTDGSPLSISPTLPTPTTLPALPVNTGGANDNREVVAELRELRRENKEQKEEIVALGRVVARVLAASGEEVSERVTTVGKNLRDEMRMDRLAGRFRP